MSPAARGGAKRPSRLHSPAISRRLNAAAKRAAEKFKKRSGAARRGREKSLKATLPPRQSAKQQQQARAKKFRTVSRKIDRALEKMLSKSRREARIAESELFADQGQFDDYEGNADY